MNINHIVDKHILCDPNRHQHEKKGSPRDGGPYIDPIPITGTSWFAMGLRCRGSYHDHYLGARFCASALTACACSRNIVKNKGLLYANLDK
jgi:hypothetical protein